MRGIGPSRFKGAPSTFKGHQDTIHTYAIHDTKLEDKKDDANDERSKKEKIIMCFCGLERVSDQPSVRACSENCIGPPPIYYTTGSA